MGAIPNRLPGFQRLERRRRPRDASRPRGARRSRRTTACTSPACSRRWSTASSRAVYVIGENPAQSRGRPAARDPPARGARPPRRAGHLPDEDGAARRRRAAGRVDAGRGRGHRHVERAARAARAQGARPAGRGARRRRDRLRARAAARPRSRQPARRGRLGRAARALADARRHDATTRLEELGGIQWPCPDEEHPGDAVPARPPLGATWSSDARRSTSVEHEPPVDLLDDDFPLRLTTGRRLESFNTGVQTGGYGSPLHRGGEAILARARGRRALRRRRRRPRARRLAPRRGRGAGARSTTRCGPGSRS